MPDEAVHDVFAVLFQGKTVVDGLASGFDGEEDIVVADRMALAIDSAKR